MLMDLQRDLQVNISRQGVDRICDGIDEDVADDWDPCGETNEAVIIPDNGDLSLVGESIARRFDRILDTRGRILASEREVQAPVVLHLINHALGGWDDADDLVVERGEAATFDSRHAEYRRLEENKGGDVS